MFTTNFLFAKPLKDTIPHVLCRDMPKPDNYKNHFFENIDFVFVYYWAVAILLSTAICPWNLFCHSHSRVFI